MRSRQKHPQVWPIAFLSTLAISCVDVKRGVEVVVAPPSRTTCATEAQQLSEAVAVYPAPESGLTPIAKLDAGRFVYRCEQRGEWLGIMFPATAEKVDCAERQPPEGACSLGWIRKYTKMELFG